MNALNFLPRYAATLVASGILFGMSLPTFGHTSVGVTLDFNYYYNTLSPYGVWYTTPEFGYVWRPTVVPAGWHPYTYGQWEAFDGGWLWVSDFSWGWLPFHYGRWYWNPRYGWSWIPGYDWAPAWVTWYYTDSYVGWAPIAPVGWGVSYTVQPSSWFFVSFNYFVSPGLYRHRVPYYRVSSRVCRPYAVVNNYYFINNYYYDYRGSRHRWYGPRREIIERHVHRRIEPRRLRPAQRRDNYGRVRERVVEVYRPEARVPSERQPRFAVREDMRRVAREDSGTRRDVTARVERPNRPEPGVERPTRPEPGVERPTPTRPEPGVERPTPTRPEPGVERPTRREREVERPTRPEPGVERPTPTRPQPGVERPTPTRPTQPPGIEQPQRRPTPPPRPTQPPGIEQPQRRPTPPPRPTQPPGIEQPQRRPTPPPRPTQPPGIEQPQRPTQPPQRRPQTSRPSPAPRAAAPAPRAAAPAPRAPSSAPRVAAPAPRVAAPAPRAAAPAPAPRAAAPAPAPRAAAPMPEMGGRPSAPAARGR